MSAALNLTTENRQSPTVLLVEDEVLVRMMLADQLREAGCTVGLRTPTKRSFSLDKISFG